MSFPSTTPEKLAHRLREAISAAAEYKEYTHYVEAIQGNFKFRAAVGCVIAQWMGVEGDAVILGHTEVKKPVKLTLSEASSLEHVIGAALQYSKETEIYFPNVILQDPARFRLWKWCSDGKWKFIDHNDGPNPAGITLTKRDVDRGILWFPKEDPNERSESR